MGLLKPKIVATPEKIRLQIPAHLLIEAKAYAAWAGFSSLNHFFEEAANYVLTKDRDWRHHKSQHQNWQQENSHEFNEPDN